MRVKIADTVYNNLEVPILVELTDRERLQIITMAPSDNALVSFPPYVTNDVLKREWILGNIKTYQLGQKPQSEQPPVKEVLPSDADIKKSVKPIIDEKPAPDLVDVKEDVKEGESPDADAPQS